MFRLILDTVQSAVRVFLHRRLGRIVAKRNAVTGDVVEALGAKRVAVREEAGRRVPVEVDKKG